ncbi:YqcC family protein [Alteromonadaceae bacterium BrNp21-10]|nr:YqcC family protein [Alteromonadaceae bacterium BrNp21-10]
MSNHLIYHQFEELLHKLQLEMQANGSWGTKLPSADALASSTPFACDTLAFEEWLQFIFIPKMQLLLNNRQPLPSSMGLLPMAEMRFATNSHYRQMLVIIAAIDAAIHEHNQKC